MASSVIFQGQVSVPLNLGTLADFRRWALSDAFPGEGRIDFIAGDIEVDMSPEDFFTHGTLKSKLVASLLHRVEALDLGHLVTDSTRLSSVTARLSAEPDVMLVTHEALDCGRVRLVPSTTGRVGRFTEVEGGPDLVAEIVSDGSAAKDSQRLPPAYFAAGVLEYWLIDARGDDLLFVIHRRGNGIFEAAPQDADGYQRSDVMQASYRLTRRRHDRGHWVYELALGAS